MTGIGSPYEIPETPSFVMATQQPATEETTAALVNKILDTECQQHSL
jgi:adenylylsulfate kinase-like enzyme